MPVDLNGTFISNPVNFSATALPTCSCPQRLNEAYLLAARSITQALEASTTTISTLSQAQTIRWEGHAGTAFRSNLSKLVSSLNALHNSMQTDYVSIAHSSPGAAVAGSILTTTHNVFARTFPFFS